MEDDNNTVPLKVAQALSHAFLSGVWTSDGLWVRAQRTLRMRQRWLRDLAERVYLEFAGRTTPKRRVLMAFLRRDRMLAHYCEEGEVAFSILALPRSKPEMRPIAAAADWNLPALTTIRQVADFLQLSIEELQWFADCKLLNPRSSCEQLRHYRYRMLAKPHGRVRLIEAPKCRLKILQRRVLDAILGQIQVHSAVHGFVRGRSIKSFAEPHVGREVVLRLDLEDFFPSICAARIDALFRSAGYPEAVAELLTALCTTMTPKGFWSNLEGCRSREARRELEELYSRRHLPQGAPTSPTLANLCAYRADTRLQALAASAGATYTRYADDLAFSGDSQFARAAARFAIRASAILLEENFRVHFRKTRIMRRGVRQLLVGLVLNARLNVRRSDYDGLKAILTNCIRWGPCSQNREQNVEFRASLLGKIGFVGSIHAERGQRLRALFDQIDWK